VGQALEQVAVEAFSVPDGQLRQTFGLIGLTTEGDGQPA
jgi:hypothetical protein